VRHAGRSERRLPAADPQLLPADPQPELAVEDVEELVLRGVHVERRRVALGSERLDHGKAVAPVVAGDEDADGSAEEPGGCCVRHEDPFSCSLWELQL
jgi:hypothetical protein